LDREIQNRLDTEGCNIDAIVEAGLGGVFIWESSPEGDTFWRNIVVNLQLDNPPT
jgi:GH18 family chitinase